MEIETKLCRMCNRCLPAGEFWRAVGRRDGLQKYCKRCLGAYNHAHKKADPKRVWAQGLRHRYGLTQEAFDALLAAQGNRCGVCGGPPVGPGKTYHVDHDHQSGRVRGLLCQYCNVALGAARDNVDHLRALIRYLECSDYTGIIDGIWDTSPTRAARITELT